MIQMLSPGVQLSVLELESTNPDSTATSKTSTRGGS